MAGAGYKLFNTGDVLTAAQVNTYLMEQTVMVFADAAARTAALSGVVSEGMISYLKSTKQVEVYNGSAWVASDDPNAIQNTIVDAKGDLIAATANDTPARLAVGNNGETLVADSSASTGLRWQPTNTGNFVINGSFDYWQRGTTFTQPSNGGAAYGSADRFRIGTFGAGGAAVTLARSTDIPTSLPVQYSAQMSWTGATAGDLNLETFIENGKFLFAGQTVTVSFYAKSSASQAYDFCFDQDYGITSITIGTSWARYSYTITLPTNYQSSPPSGAAGANYTALRFFRNNGTATRTVNITGIQVEVGSVATAFQRAGATLAGELAACQRYYIRYTGEAATGGNYQLPGNAISTTTVDTSFQLPVTMRTVPSSLDFSNLGIYRINNGTIYNTGTWALQTSFNANTVSARYIHGSAIFTQGTDSTLLVTGSNAASYVAFSAEL